MIDRLFTFVFFIYFLITATICATIAGLVRLVTQPFDQRLILLHKFATFWSSLYIWGMPAWKVTVYDRQKIDQKAAYVIVSNHQSLIDIMAGYMLHTHFKWVAKAELFRVPFVGWNLMLNRHVKIKRGDRQGIVDMMRDATTHLEQGSSVFIFPEGTRSETGEVQPFKSGAFTLAKRAKVDILPVAIIGSKDALPKGRLSIHGKHHIRVRVLDPIPYESFAEQDVKTLTERVQTTIAAAVAAG